MDAISLYGSARLLRYQEGGRHYVYLFVGVYACKPAVMACLSAFGRDRLSLFFRAVGEVAEVVGFSHFGS